jgi:hypothetical protein
LPEKYSHFKQKKPMKKQSRNLVSIICLALTVFACSKTDDATPAASGSRAIKYELTGNYTGKFILVGMTNNDNFEVMEVTKLPWKLEFTAKQGITYVLIQGTGTGGVTGQTATLKTFVGGQEVSTGTGTALSSGVVSVTNKQYFLK